MAEEPEDAENDRGARGGRPTPKAILAAVGVTLVVGLAAVGVASLLNDPVGAGARDAARPIVAGPIVAPGQELTGGPSDLPPLAVVLDQPPPRGIGSLPAEDQIPRLQALVASGAEPRRLVELGAALQATRRLEEAREAFEDALSRNPGDVAARVGLAITLGGQGPDGLDQAARDLSDLERRYPDNQIVAFNRGWVGIYLRDAEMARQAWERTVEIDPDSRLGQTSAQLLEALEQDQGQGGTTTTP